MAHLLETHPRLLANWVLLSDLRQYGDLAVQKWQAEADQRPGRCVTFPGSEEMMSTRP